MKKEIQDFLKELTELTKKHGIYIGGCGCCGSPYLGPTDKTTECDINSEDITIDGLCYDELTWENNQYTIKSIYSIEDIN